MASQVMRITLKAYDHQLVDQSAGKIIETVKKTGSQAVSYTHLNYTAYYFGDKATSSVLKGKRKVEEDDGNVSEFYFADTGKGYNGVKDGYLYYMGKLQKAESGTKYQVITIDNKNYVVNTSGKLAKSTTVKNGDGVKYKTNSTGILVKEDDEEPASSYNEPSEPVWSSHY